MLSQHKIFYYERLQDMVKMLISSTVATLHYVYTVQEVSKYQNILGYSYRQYACRIQSMDDNPFQTKSGAGADDSRFCVMNNLT